MNQLIASKKRSTPDTSSGVCRWMLMGLASLLLSGCGFKMQGEKPLPFDSLYINIAQNSQFGADIRRAIRAVSPNTKIVETPNEDASDKNAAGTTTPGKPITPTLAKLEQVNEIRSTRQVSLNAQGKVEELELSIRYTFRLVTAKNQIIIPETTLSAVRNMPFDDRVVQAKEGEAATLFKDMQRSLVSRIVRRITAPDVSTRWEALANERSEDDVPIEIAKPVRTPAVVPTPWQNPSLTPAPTPINTD